MLHGLSTFRHPIYQSSLAVLGLLVALYSSQTLSDTLAMPDGQAYSADQLTELSLDLGYRLQKDSGKPGLRLTLPPLGTHLVFFAEASFVSGVLDNVSFADVEYSGQGDGVGLFYTGMPDWRGMRSILRLSFNREQSEVDSIIAVGGRQAYVKRDIRNQRLDWLLSPRQALNEAGLTGYFSLGVAHNRLRQNLSTDGIQIEELTRKADTFNAHIAGGLVYPFKRLRIYLVADYEQQVSISLGIRALLSKSAR